MTLEPPLLNLLRLPEPEHIRIKDSPSNNVDDANIELRQEINLALEKLQIYHAHRFNGIIHAISNQYSSLQEEVDSVRDSNKEILTISMEMKAAVNQLKKISVENIANETINKTLEKFGLEGSDAPLDVRNALNSIRKKREWIDKAITAIIIFLSLATVGSIGYGVLYQLKSMGIS